LETLRRSFRVVPRTTIDEVFVDATVRALQSYELHFWEELYFEEGEEGCIYWAKLVGIFEQGVRRVIRALSRRAKVDSEEWVCLRKFEPSCPELTANTPFWSDDETGYLMWFSPYSGQDC
jgi:hypothetical protein